jgi:Tfp pilus assembly protein PilF
VGRVCVPHGFVDSKNSLLVHVTVGSIRPLPGAGSVVVTRIARFASFVEQDPANADLLRDFLDALLAEGLPADVDVWVRRAPDVVRQSAAIRFRVARAALMSGELVQSQAILGQLLSEGESAAGIRHDLAYAQLCGGDIEQAEATLEGVEATGEDAVALALLRARILYRRKQLAEAFALLADIPGTSREAEVKGLQALILVDSGESARAAEFADAALAIDAGQHEAALAIATIDLWKGRFQSATETFERALGSVPASGRALSGLGQALMASGDMARAYVVIERATVAMPDHIGTWHALAWCQLLKGELARAHQSFERAFEIDRTFGETHGGFALIHALRGERSDAEESIKRAMRLDANGRSARYARSVLLLDDGREAEAREIVQGIVAASEGHTMVVSVEFIVALRQIARARN